MGRLIRGFSSKYIANGFSLPDDLLNVFYSLAYFTVRIQYIIHLTYQICVSQLFQLWVGLSVNSRLSVVTYLGSQSYTRIFDCSGEGGG